MTDQSVATAEVQQEASTMGWVDKPLFKGDPTKWVDANEFVEKGRVMLPLIRKNMHGMEEKLRVKDTQINELTESLKASQEAIAALQEFHDEDTKRQVKKAKDGLLVELAHAKRTGDVEGEVRLTNELVELNSAIKEAKEPPPVSKTVEKAAEELDPAFLQFASENKDWFGPDKRKTAKAMGIAQLLRADPENDHLLGKAFFDRVLEEMEPASTRPVSKVATGRPTGNSGGGSSAKTFADLPQEAKDACARQSKKLVGKGRAYANMASWQAKYAEIYFKEY